jgi:hypothetical protein
MALELIQISPLPRNVKRSMLKQAIKEGKKSFDVGLDAGYRAGIVTGVKMEQHRITTAAFELKYE